MSVTDHTRTAALSVRQIRLFMIRRLFQCFKNYGRRLGGNKNARVLTSSDRDWTVNATLINSYSIFPVPLCRRQQGRCQ